MQPLLTFEIRSFDHVTDQTVLPKWWYGDGAEKYHSVDSSWRCSTVLRQFRGSLYNLNFKRKLKDKG